MLFIMPTSCLILRKHPPDLEQIIQLCILRKLAFNFFNQFIPLLVNLVLGIEQRPAFLVALGFESLDLFLYIDPALFDRFGMFGEVDVTF